MNCLSVFDHFVKLALKGLNSGLDIWRYRKHQEDTQYSINVIENDIKVWSDNFGQI